MVLSDRSIREALESGRIVIRPLADSAVQPASVDVRLDTKLRVFRPWVAPYYIDLRQPMEGITDLQEIPENGNFALAPGQFVLGSTLEYIEVPDNMMARLEGKSSLGRIGLLIHATAGYVDPGWKGHLTLELSNVTSIPILLYRGMKISQISFHRLTTPAERPYGSEGLGSKYQGQVEPTPTRFYQEFAQSPLLSLPSIPVVRKQRRRKRGSSRLKEWLAHSEFRGSVRRFAEALGTPLKTVEEWVYSDVTPAHANHAKLYAFTGLSEFEVRPTAEQRHLMTDTST